MARFIIRFYSSDNVLRKEVSVIGRKLSKKEAIKMNGKDSLEQNEDFYYVSKKNEFSIKWIIRSNEKLDFASYNAIHNFNHYKITEAY